MKALQSAARCRVVSNLLLQVSSLVQEPQVLDEQTVHQSLRQPPFSPLPAHP